MYPLFLTLYCTLFKNIMNFRSMQEWNFPLMVARIMIYWDATSVACYQHACHQSRSTTFLHLFVYSRSRDRFSPTIHLSHLIFLIIMGRLQENDAFCSPSGASSNTHCPNIQKIYSIILISSLNRAFIFIGADCRYLKHSQLDDGKWVTWLNLLEHCRHTSFLL